MAINVMIIKSVWVRVAHIYIVQVRFISSFIYPSPRPRHSLRLHRHGTLLLLLDKPGNPPIHALLQRPQRLVPQHALRLGDVVVAGHGAHDDGLAGEGRLLADDVEEDLAAEAQDETQLAAQRPVAGGAFFVAGGSPHGAGEVPEVHGRVVGDEEGFAVYALVVQGLGCCAGCGEQELRCEEVAVRDVADVREVEEVGVVAHLDVGLAVAVGSQETGQSLHVAFAEDACWADGGCEELVGVLAVGVEDEFLSGGLGELVNWLFNDIYIDDGVPWSRSSTRSAGPPESWATAHRH